MSDKERGAVRNVQGGGDLEDDAVGEWTGSEDLRTGVETTEDEVRKFSCRVVYTRPPSCVDDLN